MPMSPTDSLLVNSTDPTDPLAATSTDPLAVNPTDSTDSLAMTPTDSLAVASPTDPLEVALTKRLHQGLYRHRRCLQSAQATPYITLDNQRLIAFCSNDYLGLANDSRIKAAMIAAINHYGVGAAASQLINGYHQCHQTLEHACADFFGFPAAMYAGNGYVANQSVLRVLGQYACHILQDHDNHASLLDGGLAAPCPTSRYRHCDLVQLERKLQQLQRQYPQQRAVIVTDAVFSMTGAQANLKSLSQLARHYHAWLVVDDAHGMGVLGKSGRGSLAAAGLTADDVDILTVPLGKALGTYGGMICASQSMIEQLIQFARPLIYSTAPPPALAAATLRSLTLMQQEPWRQQRLNDNIRYFKHVAAERHVPVRPSNTAIQAIPIGDPHRALTLSEQLRRAGFLVLALRPPSVPPKQSLLRITLSCQHQPTHIQQLIATLHEQLQHTAVMPTT